MLALQSHLQCALEAGQAALPAFRTEMGSIRRLTMESKQIATDQITKLQTDLLLQIRAIFASTEKVSEELLEEAKSQNRRLDQEKQQLEKELVSVHSELDEFRKQCQLWQEERKELIASAQLCLQQREEELDQQKTEQLENQQLKYKQEIELLKEALKVAEEKFEAALNEWQSASEQVEHVNDFFSQL